MVEAPAVRVPRSEAEATRRRLIELEALRTDMEVARDGDDVLFPVIEGCGVPLPVQRWTFNVRERRPTSYVELLAWSDEQRALAPRAFDQVGDIVIVKVPPELMEKRSEIGEALRRFHGARAVFHDRGVRGVMRTRDLERIAGDGGSLTRLGENGVHLWVDVAKAYFSPRLATERAREAALVQPDEHLIDLFGGVAPLGIQAARAGAIVDTVDLNPDAVLLAHRNVRGLGLEKRVHVWEGDARQVARRLSKADRVAMNLPHGAKDFLDVAASLLKPEATLHYHEILRSDEAAARPEQVAAELRRHGWPCTVAGTRMVRNYSPTESHIVVDLKGAPGTAGKA